MRRAPLVILIASVLALAACGGEEEEPPAEQWAGGVCETVDTWRTELQTIFDDLTAQVTSGEASVDDIRSGIDDGAEATDELVETLQGLEPPETEAGQQAQEELEGIADQASGVAADAQEAVGSLGDAGITEVLAALAGVAGDIQGALSQVEGTVEAFRESADDEIREGFANAPACQELAGQTTGG
jgi:hypothetical protein